MLLVLDCQVALISSMMMLYFNSKLYHPPLTILIISQPVIQTLQFILIFAVLRNTNVRIVIILVGWCYFKQKMINV